MTPIPEIIQEKFGWQESEVQQLKSDMKQVKEDVHDIYSKVSNLEERLEAQSKASKLAHENLSRDIAEIKGWIIYGVKAILGIVVTIVGYIAISLLAV